MDTKVRTVAGSDRAKTVAAALVEASVWFTCEPMPDDQFEFTVKADAGRVLARCLNVLEQTSAEIPGAPQGGKNAIQGTILEAIAAAYCTTTEAVENDLRECEGDEDLASLCEGLAGKGY
jgi:hypothetical protein